MRTFPGKLPASVCAFILFVLPVIVSGASLTVGTKVIYPGGTDQPPLEKDSGVKFSTGENGDQTAEQGRSIPNTAQTADSLAELAESGDFTELLQVTESRNDPDSQAYKALAMYETGDTEEAEELALKLLKNQQLSDELRQKLIDELGLNIDYPEDQ
ncbi:MAG: hypothetical protein PHD82_14685 [Candidatus Riflebacteria bacterium]|nr:hypothetical protein [Candidatus Riflebacteria bacterium]